MKQKQYIQEHLQDQSDFEITEAIKHKGTEYLFHPIFINLIKELSQPYFDYDIDEMKIALTRINEELKNIESTLKELNKLIQLYNIVKSDNPINKTEISKLEKHNQFLTSLFNKFYSKNIEIIQNNIREMREQYKDLKIILKQLKRDLKISVYEFSLDNQSNNG